MKLSGSRKESRGRVDLGARIHAGPVSGNFVLTSQLGRSRHVGWNGRPVETERTYGFVDAARISNRLGKGGEVHPIFQVAINAKHPMPSGGMSAQCRELRMTGLTSLEYLRTFWGVVWACQVRNGTGQPIGVLQFGSALLSPDYPTTYLCGWVMLF